MGKISVTDARDDFSEVINKVNYAGERIVLHRRGKDLAALIPIADLEMLEAIEDLIDVEQGQKALKEASKKGTIPWAKLKKELGL